MVALGNAKHGVFDHETECGNRFFFFFSFVNENVACFTPNGELHWWLWFMHLTVYLYVTCTKTEHSVGVAVIEWSLCVNERNTCMLTYYSVRDVIRSYFLPLFVSLIFFYFVWLRYHNLHQVLGLWSVCFQPVDILVVFCKLRLELSVLRSECVTSVNPAAL